MEEKNINTNEVYMCAKCNKQKKRSEGNFVLEGTAFCCKLCCGDPSTGGHKEKASAVCEFC